MSGKIRLNKYLSTAAGISRRKADSAITEGRVSIDRKITFDPGIEIDPLSGTVRLDGKIITPIDEKIYLVLHKPVGVLTTMHDPKGRKTVGEIVDNVYPRVFPVGRLDYHTSGLLLLTNDGDLSHLLAHPRYGVEKTYLAKVRGIPHERSLGRLRRGILLEGRITAPGRFRIWEVKKDKSWILVKIAEGRYRQVRKMFAAIGHPVLKLKRTGFATITLGDLKPGEWRYLTKAERNSLIHYIKEKQNSKDPGKRNV